MKIYSQSMNYSRNEVETREIEVKETPKLYKRLDNFGIIKKSDVGILKYGYMYSLSPNPCCFLKTLIATEERTISAYEEVLNRHKEDVENLRKLLAEAESEE